MNRPGATFVLLATFGMALKGIWARLAYAEGMSVATVLFYRSAFSIPLILMTAFWFLRREGKADLRPRDYVPGVLMGVLFSVGMVCDFQAIEALGASVSRVILFGFPALVLVLTSLETQTMPNKRKIVGFSVAWIGLVAVASPGLSSKAGAPFDRSSLAWGFASLVCYAVYVWLSGKFTEKLGSVRLTSLSNLSTASIVVAVVLSTRGGSAPSASSAALGWVALMVVVSTVAPYYIFMEGIRRLGSTDASLIAMSGPVITLVAGWLVLGESLTAVQLVGTALTLTGVGAAQGVWSSRPRGDDAPSQKDDGARQISRKIVSEV